MTQQPDLFTPKPKSFPPPRFNGPEKDEYKPADHVLMYELHSHAHFPAFQIWIEKHPEVLAMFKAEANKLIREKRHFGMWHIANKIRWEKFYNHQDEEFKIKNDYIALITRVLMLESPELINWCRIKRLGAIETPI